MECAVRGGVGCGSCAGGSDGQAHQRRFSKCCLDPAGQHHDAGARLGYDLICTAHDRAVRQCVTAIATTDSSDVAGGGKEAAGAETPAPSRAGFDRASDGCSRSGCACGLE